MNPKWNIREASPNDVEFIYATWLNSYHYDSWTKHTQKSIFFNNYKKVIDHILLDAKTLVACDINDTNVIYGYLVYDENLHYLYVKESFREFGIAKSLVAKAFKDQSFQCTHKTRKSVPILRKKPNIIYNPFILFKKE